MDVAREISAAFARIAAEDAEESLRLRYRRAKDIAASIPSGTAEADLTSEQKAALDEYDATIEALAQLREWKR